MTIRENIRSESGTDGVDEVVAMSAQIVQEHQSVAVLEIFYGPEVG